MNAQSEALGPAAEPSKLGIKQVGGYFPLSASAPMRQVPLSENTVLKALLTESPEMLLENVDVRIAAPNKMQSFIRGRGLSRRDISQ